MDEIQDSQTPGSNGATKWIVGVIVLALIVWAVYANNKQGSQQNGVQNQSAGDSYKIGVLVPLTGDAASYGEPAKNVYQMAADEINANGGINGKKIELDIQDGKCNGQDASSAMQKLVNIDKVQVVLGGFCSGESLAAEPIAEANKVLMISAASSSPKLTGIGNFFVRNYPSDSSQGIVLADIAYNKKGWKKIVLFQEQTDYAAGINKSFTTKFESLGGSVVSDEFATNAADLRSQLTKLKAENPDAFFLDSQTPASAARILKQIQDLNWKTNYIFSDVVPTDTATVNQFKTMLEGSLAAEIGVDQSNPKFKHLSDSYKAKFNTNLPFATYSQTTYDSVYLLRDGISEVGYDGSKLSTWFRTVKDWQGASGKITIGQNGDPLSGFNPMMLKDGQLVPFAQ